MTAISASTTNNPVSTLLQQMPGVSNVVQDEYNQYTFEYQPPIGADTDFIMSQFPLLNKTGQDKVSNDFSTALNLGNCRNDYVTCSDEHFAGRNTSPDNIVQKGDTFSVTVPEYMLKEIKHATADSPLYKNTQPGEELPWLPGQSHAPIVVSPDGEVTQYYLPEFTPPKGPKVYTEDEIIVAKRQPRLKLVEGSNLFYSIARAVTGHYANGNTPITEIKAWEVVENIKEWQKGKELPPTGLIDRATFETLDLQPYLSSAEGEPIPVLTFDQYYQEQNNGKLPPGTESPSEPMGPPKPSEQAQTVITEPANTTAKDKSHLIVPDKYNFQNGSGKNDGQKDLILSIQENLPKPQGVKTWKGIWGNKTKEALKQYQTDNSLTVTGTLTTETLTHMGIDINE